MSESTDRTTVRTYVPEYQYETWAEDADSMDMSLSEFVRTMVQAGRRDFDIGDGNGAQSPSPEEPHVGRATPGGDGLEDRILERLDADEVVSWDELVDMLAEDFESKLESTLDSLLDAGAIQLDHRRGGYRRRGEQ